VAYDPRSLPDEVLTFLAERHLATLTTLRADGSPHVVAVGFTWDDDAGLARVITFAPSQKAANVARGAEADGDMSAPDPSAAEASGSPASSGSPAPRAAARAAVCQVDGGRWLTLEGVATVTSDPARVAEAVRRYAERYRPPGERSDRVAIEIRVDRVLGRA
jgi:hypothetical protein